MCLNPFSKHSPVFKLINTLAGWMALWPAAALLLGLSLVMGSPIASKADSLGSLLPPSGSALGWKVVGTPHIYDANSLYDLIDGEADAVKAYAFAGVIDGRYSPNSSTRTSIDFNLYDKSDPLNAYGLFSQDREGAQPLAIGAGGCRTSDGTGLSFWKDRYLVRIASTTRDRKFLDAMVVMAKNIAGRIHGSSQPPALIRSLPAGARPDTVQYRRENVEGHAFISNAVTARYPSAGMSAELFIAQY